MISTSQSLTVTVHTRIFSKGTALDPHKTVHAINNFRCNNEFNLEPTSVSIEEIKFEGRGFEDRWVKNG
jgi:hypothetical protein